MPFLKKEYICLDLSSLRAERNIVSTESVRHSSQILFIWAW